METTSVQKNTSTRSVSFLNLRKLVADHRQEYLEALMRVADQAAFIGGAEVNKFETDFAKWVNSEATVIGAANGTDAITLAAKALNLPEGSEAVAPAMTYIATVAGLRQAGLKVKLVDVEEGTWLMDPTKLDAAINSNTRLLAPVHFYGQMADMDRISKVATKKNLRILEDAAQAHGSTWNGKTIGHYGDVATFSFYPGKNLGAFGDAGAVLTRNAQIALRCRALGNQGGIKKYEHDLVGYNSRLDNLQAAVLNVKLKYLDGWNNARRKVASLYNEMLGDCRQIQLPKELQGGRHVYHLFVIITEDRDALAKFLKERGVETGIHYPKAIHQLAAFQDQEFATQKFPNAEKVAKHGLSLPMCPTLSEEDIRHVAASIRAYFA